MCVCMHAKHMCAYSMHTHTEIIVCVCMLSTLVLSMHTRTKVIVSVSITPPPGACVWHTMLSTDHDDTTYGTISISPIIYRVDYISWHISFGGGNTEVTFLFMTLNVKGY